MTDTEHMREDNAAFVERMMCAAREKKSALLGKHEMRVEMGAFDRLVGLARRAAAPSAQGDVERVARVLYECEKRRAEQARDVLRSASGKPCSGILMEPYEECAEVFRSDARAALAAMPSPAEAERRGMMRARQEMRDLCHKCSDEETNSRDNITFLQWFVIELSAQWENAAALPDAPAPDALRNGEPSKTWLAENITHHLARNEMEMVGALRSVAEIALTEAEYNDLPGAER